MKVIIVGGGVSGLASSIRLAYSGHEVLLVEQNTFLGGKLSEINLDGYRFDAGPSLFTLPHLVEDLLAIDDKNNVDFSYERLHTICKYFWKDGSTFAASGDRSTFINQLSESLGEDPNSVLRFMDNNKRKYLLTQKLFLESPIKSFRTWISSEALRAYSSLHKLDIFSKMHDVHLSSLKNKKSIQLFDRYATYNGSNPYKSSGIMTMISHLEYDLGAYFPEGGMYSIVKALKKKAVSLGVKLHLEEPVLSINHKNNKITGISTTKGNYSSNVVLSNLDNYFTYKNLLNDALKAKRIKKQERSTSAIIFYWGISRSFPQLELHNIFFSENYQEEFREIEKNEISKDPTIYLNISSHENPNDAPSGHENWFVMVNVPAEEHVDEKLLVSTYRKILIAKLSERLGVNLSSLITCEEYISPSILENRTGAYLGALYGLSSNNKLVAFFRENNKSKKYKGLFFCGGTVHPGGGIPLCLLSAKITSNMIDEYIYH